MDDPAVRAGEDTVPGLTRQGRPDDRVRRSVTPAVREDVFIRSEEAIRRAQALRAHSAEVSVRIAATAAELRRLDEAIASSCALQAEAASAVPG
jgi:hypothetical protein